MVALEALMRDMYSRWAVPLQNVVGHSETALGRKPDILKLRWGESRILVRNSTGYASDSKIWR